MKFRVYYSIDAVLTLDQIWPDGNAPENPTEQDVLRVLEECGGPRDVISDWNLDDNSKNGFIVTKEGKL